MQQFDAALIEWIREHWVVDWLTPVLRVVTYFGEYGAGWILLAVVLLCFKKTRRMGLTMGIAMLAGFLLGEVFLKNVIRRPRPFTLWPEMELLIFEPSGFSCPSGHTTSSFAAAISVLLCNKRWGAAALVLAAAIGFSRMYFTVHYLTDVLFGIALGVACGFAAWFLTGRIWNSKQRKEGAV